MIVFNRLCDRLMGVLDDCRGADCLMVLLRHVRVFEDVESKLSGILDREAWGYVRWRFCGVVRYAYDRLRSGGGLDAQLMVYLDYLRVFVEQCSTR